MPALQVLPLVALLAASIGCQPVPPSPPANPQGDEFAVVRQRAERAYREGRQHLERDELEAALVSLDEAKLNDPDGRADIQAGLDEALRRLQARPPVPTGTPLPVRTPAPASTVPPLGRTVLPAASPIATSDLLAWSDPGQRFTMNAPRSWLVASSPQAVVGTGVVSFREPEGSSGLTVAADEAAHAVSPELYAARIELAMAQAPGYALDSLVPGSTAGTPSVRRSFSISQRDSSGAARPFRGFQVVLVRGSTAWVLDASAPSERYASVAPTFERMVESFVFR